MRKPNRAAYDLIREFESFSSVPYQDQAGIWTVGFGHTGIDVTEDSGPVSQGQAEVLLEEDVDDAVEIVERVVSVVLSDNQFGALVVFAFNTGTLGHDLLDTINAGDFENVPAQMERWCHVTVNGQKVVSRGLLRRRQAEAALWSRA